MYPSLREEPPLELEWHFKVRPTITTTIALLPENFHNFEAIQFLFAKDSIGIHDRLLDAVAQGMKIPRQVRDGGSSELKKITNTPALLPLYGRDEEVVISCYQYLCHKLDDKGVPVLVFQVTMVGLPEFQRQVLYRALGGLVSHAYLIKNDLYESHQLIGLKPGQKVKIGELLYPDSKAKIEAEDLAGTIEPFGVLFEEAR